MLAQLIKFTTQTRRYTNGGGIYRDKNTIGYHIVNTGGCLVEVNGLPLYPSGVLDTMYSGYIDQSQYNILFAAGGSNPEITVITFQIEE